MSNLNKISVQSADSGEGPKEMKFRLAISNNKPLMKAFMNIGLIALIAISLFSIFAKNELLNHGYPLVYVLMPLMILIVASIIFGFKIKKYSAKEYITLEKNSIRSPKFGVFEIGKIVSYNFFNASGIDNLNLKMNDGTKLSIGSVNLKKNNYEQYQEFKELFLKIIMDNNKQRKLAGNDLIIEKKSILQIIYYVITLIIIICGVLKWMNVC